jgi:hypothetical protein
MRRETKMKSTLSILIAWMVVSLLAAPAAGHGTPVHVGVSGGRLVVSGGLSDANSFASMIYVEDDEDGDPFGEVSLPSLGPVVLWQIPGFEISGMDNNSDLSIELLVRPANDVDSPGPRALWYWNAGTELVEPAPSANSLFLLGTGMRSLAISPETTTAPPPFLMADPMAGQQGFHNHSLLSYAIDNSPSAPSGAYGFFARLTSSDYLPSDPFLIVLNRDTDYAEMELAARAINAAAFLAGDYNHNDEIDAADYTVWRNSVGQTGVFLAADGNGDVQIDAEDYQIWKTHYGDTFPAIGSGPFVLSLGSRTDVPEPPIFASCAALVLALGACRHRRVRFGDSERSAS